MSIEIIPREGWGAEPAKRTSKLWSTRDGWFFHWLGVGYPREMSDVQILQSVQRFHKYTRGWSDIAYSWAVGRDARAYECRGEGVAGGHTYGFNKTSYAIVFLIGQGEEPTPEMYRTAWALVAQIEAETDRVRGHRDVGSTFCPGNEIYDEIINQTFRDPGAEPMTPEEANYHVNWGYDNILDRPADPEGEAFWTEQLVSGASTVNNMRWEMLIVRLAADKAADKALAEQIDSVARVEIKTGDIEVVARNIFYAELREIAGVT